jgi:hypothetical protein
MRALGLRGFGETSMIRNPPIPDATVAPLIRVQCAGVNPIDYKPNCYSLKLKR